MTVMSLGYVALEATDLNAWREFAVDLLGLAVANEDNERLQLRMDEHSYRLDIRRSSDNRVVALGWEVGGPRRLAELVEALQDAGVPVRPGTAEEARMRYVAGLAITEDPDGQRIELFYALKTARTPFVSLLGTRFVTGVGGMGHAFQFVTSTPAHEAFYTGILGFRLTDYIEFGTDAATFLHCNPRHHSFAFAEVPHVPLGFGHLMFEVDDIDAVGRAWDRVLAGEAVLSSTLGRHTNDAMLSFYVMSPGGFSIEFGYGGRTIDRDAAWSPTRYEKPSVWGHKRMTASDEPDI